MVHNFSGTVASETELNIHDVLRSDQTSSLDDEDLNTPAVDEQSQQFDKFPDRPRIGSLPIERHEVLDRHFDPRVSTPIFQASLREEKKISSKNFLFQRVHFVNEISKTIDRVVEKEPHNVPDILRILHLIRSAVSRIPDDNYVGILLALHDALSYDNEWSNVSADQFSKARDVLVKFSKSAVLSHSAVQKAIFELEDIGFDTLPFED